LTLLIIGISCNEHNPTIREKKYSIDSVKLSIRQLRGIGFFKNYNQYSDDQIFEILHQRRIKEYSEIFERYYDPGMELEKYEILALDSTQIVFGDTEADVAKGNNAYVSLLKTFSTASAGLFAATNIREDWVSEKGPIYVTFTSNGNEIKFEASFHNDYLDEKIFDIINQEMLKKGDEKFFFVSDGEELEFGQEYMFIRMTFAQKDSVEKALHWKFL